jgi:thiol-disulfide isomerase/thioredoxin
MKRIKQINRIIHFLTPALPSKWSADVGNVNPINLLNPFHPSSDRKKGNLMKTAGLRGILAGLCLLVTMTAANAAEKIVWAKSLNEAMAQAKKSNKLVMVDFYTDWCGWCKELDKKTYSDARVGKAATQLVSVKVNAEKEGVDAAKKYKVNGFPTILFLAPNGDVAGRIGGYMPPEPFMAEMNKFVTAHRDLPRLEAKAQGGSADATTLAKLTAIYAGKNDADKARTTLAQLERTNPAQAGANLAKAYNAVGDMYQTAEQFDKAIPLFTRAAKVGKTPQDISYAHISNAVCHFSAGSPKKAIPSLKAILAMKNAPADYREQAQQMLNVANR